MAKKRSNHRMGDMDALKLPDENQLKALNSPKHGATIINKYADVLFSSGKSRGKGSFERAVMCDDPDVNLKPPQHDEQQEEDLSTYAAKEIPKATGLDRGIKFGKQFIRKKALIICSSVLACIILVALICFPPLIVDNNNKTSVDKDSSILRSMGMAKLKAYAATHYSVSNINAFGSEREENYRTVKLVYKAKNFSPFKLEIPKFEVKKIDPKYADKIAYISFAEKTANGDQKPVVVPAFSSKEITIEVMVNVSKMNESQFNEAVSSMVLSSCDMNRKVFGISVPCVPSLIFVSKDIKLDLN